MMYVIILFSVLMTTGNMTVFDFNKNSDLSKWMIVDDVVMGGRSNGHFEISEEGYGIFSGDVSLENNGGFSSVRYYSGTLKVDTYKHAIIKLKGDGKSYQFRIKSDDYERYSYVYEFQTSGDWETIEIPLSDMEPRFRGRKLNIPNYPGETVEEIAILIGNKRNESFRMEIDYIEMR